MSRTLTSTCVVCQKTHTEDIEGDGLQQMVFPEGWLRGYAEVVFRDACGDRSPEAPSFLRRPLVCSVACAKTWVGNGIVVNILPNPQGPQ